MKILAAACQVRLNRPSYNLFICVVYLRKLIRISFVLSLFPIVTLESPAELESNMECDSGCSEDDVKESSEAEVESDTENTALKLAKASSSTLRPPSKISAKSSLLNLPIIKPPSLPSSLVNAPKVTRSGALSKCSTVSSSFTLATLPGTKCAFAYSLYLRYWTSDWSYYVTNRAGLDLARLESVHFLAPFGAAMEWQKNHVTSVWNEPLMVIKIYCKHLQKSRFFTFFYTINTKTTKLSLTCPCAGMQVCILFV